MSYQLVRDVFHITEVSATESSFSFLILLSAGAESVVAKAHLDQGFAWLG